MYQFICAQALAFSFHASMSNAMVSKPTVKVPMSYLMQGYIIMKRFPFALESQMLVGVSVLFSRTKRTSLTVSQVRHQRTSPHYSKLSKGILSLGKLHHEVIFTTRLQLSTVGVTAH